MSQEQDGQVTAAVLLIGDEILSGRTKDQNLAYIAEYLGVLGVDVREARAVPDVEAEIVAAVNALRARYSYLFTTGGIGPTHDDITADAIAKAFGVAIGHDPRAVGMLRERYAEGELNEARLRMARVPLGATLIPNPVSKAPGFRIGNVFVMAGVPKIMQAMLDAAAPQLQRGKPTLAWSLEVSAGEGEFAMPLREVQAAMPQVLIGSYPFERPGGGHAARIVVRSRDPAALDAAEAAVRAMVGRLEVPGKAKAWS
jgi:molybdenum cofactor synthesis domain-containing protein